MKQNCISKTERRAKIARIVGTVLFVSLVLSLVYALIRFLAAPAEIPDGQPYQKVKTDYLLMMTQCLLGLLVMMLPTFIAHRWKVVVPNTIVILYFIFLYCAIYLGEVRNFYYVIPHWDGILHAFSGAMLGALGFILVDLLNRDQKVHVHLSPFFIAVFAFCFALAVGALWEVYEFSFDAILGLNMQKHTTEEGMALLGAAAVSDTMRDLIADSLAALAVSVLGFLLLQRKNQNDTKQ